jgi:hypothetical protein
VPKMEQTPSSKLCWGCERNQRASQGPPGPLGVVLTSPPAVLGGPMKTGSKLPVLGEIEDSDVSDLNNYVLTYVVLVACDHDVITCDEMGLDAGAGPNKQADSNDNNDRMQTDSRSQLEPMSRSRSEGKATPPPRGQGTRPPWTGHDRLES